MEKLIGYCSVDSGQVMLTDPCYVKDFKDDGELDFSESKEVKELYPYTYSGACDASLNGQGGGQLAHPLGHAGAGVCVSTAYGDGQYPVYAEYEADGKTISSVRIEFLEEENLNVDFEDCDLCGGDGQGTGDGTPEGEICQECGGSGIKP